MYAFRLLAIALIVTLTAKSAKGDDRTLALTAANRGPALALDIDEAGTLSLPRLVEEVLRRNPGITEAAEALNAALAMIPQAKAFGDPTFSYALAPGTIGNPAMGPAPDATHFDLGQRFTIEQSFPWPGKLRLRGQAASQQAEGERGNAKVVREELAEETKKAYYELWYVYRALEINSTNQSLLLDFQHVAETRYAAGEVTKQDVLQAGVEYDYLLHDAVVLERMRNSVAARINTLLDRPTETQLPDPPKSISGPIPLPDLKTLQEVALANRPELDVAGSRIEAGRTNVRLARKEFYPDFSIMAGYDGFWQEHELRPMIGFSLNLPVQLGRRRGAVHEAEARLSGLEAERRRTQLRIALEVHEAVEEIGESHHAIEIYETRLLPAASENIDVARIGYSTGKTNLAMLIAAQKSLLDTTLRLQETRASYQQSVAKLERATGTSVTHMLRASE